jgi:ATP-dependent phosphofructokinase / diphosphate-dependent phosphofructokinase
MRLGVLTGGGDCPGLNAAIRAIVIRATALGDDVIGFEEGWKGPLEGLARPLTLADVEGILDEGGTILLTSRTNPFKVERGPEQIAQNLAKSKIDCLIGIGGEDTLGVLARLAELGTKAVGVPKTIDADLNATEYTIGFNSAVTVATDAIDRLHTTARSHKRAIVCEVMGRHAGWMTWAAGIAGGAHAILLPEEPFDVDEVCDVVKKRFAAGQRWAVIAVAEGAVPLGGAEMLKGGEKDAFGHVALGGVSEWLAKEIEKRTGVTSRHVILGHIQRGGTPTVTDRLIGTRLGVAAVDAAHAGKFGTMVAVRGDEMVPVPLGEAVGKLRTVDAARRGLSKALWGL